MNKKLLLIAMLAMIGTTLYADGVSKVEYNRNNALIQGQLDDLNQKADATDERIDGIVQGNKEINNKQDTAIAQNGKDIAGLKEEIKEDKFAQSVRDNNQDEKIKELGSELNTKIDKAVDNIYTNLDGVADRMDTLNQEMVKADEANKNEIDRLDKEKLNKEQYKLDQSVLKDKVNNKLDKDKYEADKNTQADKDKLQDEKIKANHNKVNKVEQNLNDLKEQSEFNDKLLNDKISQNKNEIAQNKADQDEVNKAQAENNKAQDEAIKNNSNRIDTMEKDFAQYDNRISGVERKVDELDGKMNKGLSLMAAMAAVDFQNVEEGEMAIGAGVGHYGNAQSVAVGVAYSPVQNLNLNLKYSVTAGDIKSSAIGAGASYKFRVK